MRLLTPFLALALASGADVASAQEADNERVTDSEEVVLKKMYPRAHHLQLDFDAGTILNQSYVDTYLLRAGATWFFAEHWGLGLSFASALNKDKDARKCVESFYNDPDHEVAAQCRTEDEGDEIHGAKSADVGPAYPPVRELKYVATADVVWSPVYGKQIFLHGATNHFDVQLTAGLGLAASEYYPEQTHLRDHPERPSRGDFPADGTNGVVPGTKPDEHDANGSFYGDDGRPESERVTSPVLHLAVAERWLFLQRFSLRFELANYTLLGTPSGFESVFAIFAGGGVRF